MININEPSKLVDDLKKITQEIDANKINIDCLTSDKPFDFLDKINNPEAINVAPMKGAWIETVKDRAKSKPGDFEKI